MLPLKKVMTLLRGIWSKMVSCGRTTSMSPFLVAVPSLLRRQVLAAKGPWVISDACLGVIHPTFRTGLINTLLLRVVGQPSGLATFFGQRTLGIFRY